MSVTPKLTLPAKTADTAPPKVAPRLKDAQQRLGFLPNMYANMANAPGDPWRTALPDGQRMALGARAMFLPKRRSSVGGSRPGASAVTF